MGSLPKSLMFVAGFVNLAFSSMSQTLVQLNAPDRSRGRIIGVYNMAAHGMKTFSGITVGMFGSIVGIHWSLALSTVALIAAVGVAVAVDRSEAGLAIRAMGDDQLLSQIFGVRTQHLRVFIFALGSAVGAASGALNAHRYGVYQPSDLGPEASLMLVVYVIVGGKRNLAGPVLGTLALPLWIPQSSFVIGSGLLTLALHRVFDFGGQGVNARVSGGLLRALQRCEDFSALHSQFFRLLLRYDPAVIGKLPVYKFRNQGNFSESELRLCCRKFDFYLGVGIFQQF